MNEASEKQKQEQLDVVLRLNKLTKQGKLPWQRAHSAQAENSHDMYIANLKSYRIVVEESPSRRGLRTRLGRGALLEREASYRLRIRPRRAGSEDDDQIVIPPMPAIDDLVSTIRRVNDEPNRAKGDLDDLRSFKKHLNEEL